MFYQSLKWIHSIYKNSVYTAKTKHWNFGSQNMWFFVLKFKNSIFSKYFQHQSYLNAIKKMSLQKNIAWLAIIL